MKALALIIALNFTLLSCMKSREDYRKAIDTTIQKEESRDEREKGSNDAEGMGMDE